MPTVEDQIRDLCDPRKNPQLRLTMNAVGKQIADTARAAAPRSDRVPRNGHGADSIRHEERSTGGELHIRVSWDKPHFYMSFMEFGTSKIRPKMFLLGAARQYG